MFVDSNAFSLVRRKPNSVSANLFDRLDIETSVAKTDQILTRPSIFHKQVPDDVVLFAGHAVFTCAKNALIKKTGQPKFLTLGLQSSFVCAARQTQSDAVVLKNRQKLKDSWSHDVFDGFRNSKSV